MLAPTDDRRRGVIYALICLLLLGLMPHLAAAGPKGGGLVFAVGLTLWQLTFAVPLTVIEARQGGMARLRLPAGVLVISVVTAGIFGLSTWAYITAAEKAGPVTMAIALQVYPFVAMAVEALAEGRPFRRAEVIWTAVMVLAMAGLLTEGRFALDGVSVWAAFTLAVPVMWAVAHMLLRRVLRQMPVTPNQVTISRLVISGVMLTGLVLALGQGGQLAALLADPGFHRAAAALGLAYYLELIFWFHAMRHIDVSLGSALTVPAPALTMVLGALVFGTPVAPFQIGAMVVVMVALVGLLRVGK